MVATQHSRHILGVHANIITAVNRRIVYSSGHQGTFNPAVITNKEVHMVHGNINTDDETSHTTSNAKKRSLKISDYFCKQNGKPSLSGELTLHNFCYFFLNLFYN